MGLFHRRPKTKIPQEHATPVDVLYAGINVEEVGVYQRYFDRIIAHVDMINYTNWSLSHEYDRAKLDADEEWMYGVLQEAEGDGISGALLQNMVNQYFFADMLLREQDKRHWVRRIMHPEPVEYFPGATEMRLMMEMVSG